MRTSGWARQGAAGLRDERGVSLIEMMMTIAVAAIIGVGLYQIFNANQKASISQRLRNDVQTSCTFAIDQMKNEMALGGYRATNEDTPITAAGAGSITFEYWDDNAPSANWVGYDNHTQITYRRATTAEPGIEIGDLVREYSRYKAGAYVTSTTKKQVLVQNVTDLAFAYKTSDNTDLTAAQLNALSDTIALSPLSTDPALLARQKAKIAALSKLRTIRASLTCSASKEDPVTKKPATVTLTAEVRARNVGVAAAASDTTPPNMPTGLAAWDTGKCGTLELRWDANTDVDLEGYTIYYGLSPSFTQRLRIQRAPRDSAALPEYYSLTLLTSTITGQTPVKYYIAIDAFDKSGNSSATTSPIDGLGDPEGGWWTMEQAIANGSDTVVNPKAPDRPPTFDAFKTPGVAASVSFTWTAPNVSELAGFRLYRSTSEPVPTDAAHLVADETRLTATTFTFTDNGSTPLPSTQLVGCQRYYYKLCAVTCDATLVASYDESKFITDSEEPDDFDAPPAPRITAMPGWKRIILNLTNPVKTGATATPNFDYTTIYFSTNGPLTLHANGSVSDAGSVARTIPDPSDLEPGVFRGEGAASGAINFDDPYLVTPTDGLTKPNLTEPVYYFLAVARDLCGKFSTREAQAEAQAKQCKDCDGSEGQETCVDAPYPPINLRVNLSDPPGSGCYGPTTLTWDYPESYFNTHPDVKAFRLQRRELNGTTFDDSYGPITVLNEILEDKDFLDSAGTGLEDGKVYSYRVEAYDCYYFEWVAQGRPGSITDAADNISSVGFPADGSDPHKTVDLNGVSLGAPVADATLPVLTGTRVSGPDGILWNADDSKNFYHNTATFGIGNTSDAADPNRLTLDGLTAASVWDNLAAYLQKVDIGDAPPSPLTHAFTDPATTLSHGHTGTTVTFDNKAPIGPKDLQIPVGSTFMNVDRSVDINSDMRTNWIDYTFSYSNPSTGATGCTSRATFYAPLGPYIYSVTQDRPYVGTLGWPVPGDSGNMRDNVPVPGGQGVTVTAQILDSTGSPTATGAVSLFYAYDLARTSATAPEFAGTTYTRTEMTRVVAGGNQWSATIPAADATKDVNVWYFIVAQDPNGNFDRDPEPWAGAYEYWQQKSDDCNTTPAAPTHVNGSVNSSKVVRIQWAAPTKNADGTPISDLKGYRVYRERNGTASPSPWPHEITNPATMVYDDTTVAGDIESARYSYYVTAIDTCTDPKANESAHSASYAEGLENDCANTPMAPHLNGTTYESGGGYVVLSWTPPTMNAPPSTNSLTDLATYQIWRRVEFSTGAVIPGYDWHIKSTVSSSTTSINDTSPSGYAINAYVFKYYVKACDSCSHCSDGSNVYTDSETTTPCAAKPQAPTSFSGNATQSGVTLTWAPPLYSTDGINYVDAKGFLVERSKDNFATYTIIGFPNATATMYVDSDASMLADIATADYSYRVKAQDMCTPCDGDFSACTGAPTGVYTEQYVDDCATRPNPPSLHASTYTPAAEASTADGSGVTLWWTPPTSNALPSDRVVSYTDPGGYEVWRRLTDAGGTEIVAWQKIATLTDAIYQGSGPFEYKDESVKDNVTTAPYTFNIGDAAKKYSYYVKAVDSCTCSTTPPLPFSCPNVSEPSTAFEETYTDACVSLATPEAAPSGLTATKVGGCTGASAATAMTLAWTAPAGTAPSGYRVYGCLCADYPASCTCVPTSNDRLNATDPLPLTPRSFTHTIAPTLMNSVQWRYAVKAVNKSTACTDPNRWKESAFSGYVLDACE